MPLNATSAHLFNTSRFPPFASMRPLLYFSFIKLLLSQIHEFFVLFFFFFHFFSFLSFTYISFSSPHPHTVMLRRSERAAVWYLDAYQVLNYYICSTRCKNFQGMSKKLLIPCVIRGTDSPSGNVSLLYVSWCMLTSHMIFQSRFAHIQIQMHNTDVFR